MKRSTCATCGTALPLVGNHRDYCTERCRWRAASQRYRDRRCPWVREPAPLPAMSEEETQAWLVGPFNESRALRIA